MIRLMVCSNLDKANTVWKEEVTALSLKYHISITSEYFLFSFLFLFYFILFYFLSIVCSKTIRWWMTAD